MEREPAYFNGAFASSALWRFRHSIATDAGNAVAVVLGAAVNEGTATGELARWCLTDDAAGLRLRWARELEKAAGEAAAPVWAVVDVAEFVDAGTGKGEARAKLKSTGPDGLLWAVGVVLASPVMTDELRKVVRDDLTKKAAAIEPIDLPWVKHTAEWAWLGGDFQNVEEDDGAEPPEGYEVVARFARPAINNGQSMRLIRRSAPPGYLRLFAWALWRERWKEEADNAYRQSAKIIALTTRMTNQVVDLLSPASMTVRSGNSLEIVRSDGRKVGELHDDDVLSVLRGWSGTLVDTDLVHAAADNLARAGRTAAAVGGFLHALKTTTDLYRNTRELRAEWPTWKAWAQDVADFADLSLNSELRGTLCDFAWYGNTVQLMLFDGRIQRGLWTVTAPDPHRRGPAPRGSSSAVAFRYGDLLDPGWSRRENPTDRNRGVHLLVVPDRLPVAIADRAAKGPAQLYSLLMLAEVCDRLDHRYVSDGAVVSLAYRCHLADRAGLTHENELRQLRGGLLDGGLLIEVEPNRYTLGDQKARAMRAHTRPQPRRRARDRE